MSWFKKALKVVLIVIAVVLAVIAAIYLLSFLLVTLVGHGAICTAVAIAANAITTFLVTPTFLGCTYGTLCSLTVVAAVITGYAVLGDIRTSPTMHLSESRDYLGEPVPSGPGSVDQSGSVDEWKDVGEEGEDEESGWTDVEFEDRPGGDLDIVPSPGTESDGNESSVWIPVATCAGLLLAGYLSSRE